MINLWNFSLIKNKNLQQLMKKKKRLLRRQNAIEKMIFKNFMNKQLKVKKNY